LVSLPSLPTFLQPRPLVDMRLTRVFVDLDLKLGQMVELDTTVNQYLTKVLRLKPNDRVALFNGRCHADFIGLIDKLKRNSLQIKLLDKVEKITDSTLLTHIIQAISRSDHIDFSIQKASELGVSSLIFFNSEFTQSPVKTSNLDRKLQHWQNIAIKACEQSGRHFIPHILFYKNLQLALQTLPIEARRILLDLSGNDLIDNNWQKQNLENYILLGNEGGLSQEEISLAANEGFISYQLGPRVLRTETAAIAALAVIQYQLGDMKKTSS